MRVASAVVGGIGATLGGVLPPVFVLVSLLLAFYPPGEGAGLDAFLVLVVATHGVASACYLAALVGAGVALMGRRRTGAMLMAGGGLGAAGAGVAYVLLLDAVMHPIPPSYPSWPEFVVVYLLPAAVLLVCATVALASRPSESLPSPEVGN